jgi:hypothetical protein
MAKRGIVITPKFNFDGRALSFVGGFDPISLRQYLLYWDKLDWPDNNAISIGEGGPDMDFLESAGVLERTRVDFSSFSGNIGYAMLGMQVVALQIRNERQPGCWSLAQDSQTLVASPEGTVESRSIEVALYSAVPVPTQDVSYDDILEFKRRRDDELKSFRSVMDDLYQQVIAAADIPRAKLQAITRLEKAVQELNNVFGESFSNRFLSSLKVELNIPNIAAFAAGGAVAASTFGIPLAIGASVGAIAAAVRFDLSYIRKGARIPEQLKDYAYLHHIERELG